MRKRVLVVEAQERALRAITQALDGEGYAAVGKRSISGALSYLKNNVPDMVILDLELPDGSGLALAGKIRKNAATTDLPIIVFSGRRELEIKKNAFLAGADQYLVKPMPMPEFLLWVEALFRRMQPQCPQDRHGGDPANINLDKESLLVLYGGKVIPKVTGREFQLLEYLIGKSPKVISREEIIADAWHTVAVDNLVDTHIYNLRHKLPQGAAGKIQSVPGRGFRYLGAQPASGGRAREGRLYSRQS